MRRLTRSVWVKAPGSFAMAFLNTYFTDRGAQTTGAELALRFPLPRLFVDGLTIEKRVTVYLKYRAGSGPLSIGWEPSGRDAVPGFDGTLEAAGGDESTCRLTIAGSYTPPGGTLGSIFDALVGMHIAGATMNALLENFTRLIEAEYSARLVP